ncbi:hypothetical protein B9Z55_015926 [Caenorhabditis nigoni]|uniref:F-box domain-containing protein n=1 Tax=Caenorhabditis nigoni TaxID=1611254 RepID=A0A2G5UCQ7_9PELO|nr:hypothetical protein B9Z55_015926 [Caenorhabditis nigoni]
MPFPILRTPFIVLSEIISLLEPNEIVTASFCSKNVQRLLERHYQRRKPVEWRLVMQDYDSRGRVKIRTSEGGKGITVMSVRPISELSEELQAKAKRNGYMLMFNTQFVTAYMENQMMTAKSVVNTIRQLFNLDVFAVVMDTNGTWAIDWINNRQEMILGGIEFYRNPKDHSNADETVDYVLRNARFSLYCNIDGNVSDNFKFNGKLGPMRQLWIKSNGHWVTCDNLMNFDSITILIEGSRLSVSDLNSFLRHWRAGASARLEYLRLIFEEHTFIERFDEELEVVKTDEKKIFRRSRYVYFS